MLYRGKKVFAIFVVVIFVVCWSIIWLYTDIVKGYLPTDINYDMLYYISMLVGVVLIFVLSMVLNKKQGDSMIKEDFKRENSAEKLSLIGFIILGGMVFVYEPFTIDAGSYYMPYHINKSIEAVIGILFVVILYYVQKKMILDVTMDCNLNLNLKFLYVSLAFIAGYGIYQPNCFNKFYDVHHTHAYFNSVYRVIQMQPYSEINCGIYGFYGILLAPLTRIFGGNIQSCVIVLSLLTVINVICYYYILDKLVDRVWIKIIACIAIIMPYISLSGNTYYQNFPHRTLFVGFVLAYIVWKEVNSRREKKCFFLGIGLCALSLVWNLETGVACLFAYIGSNIVFTLQCYSVKSKKCWKTVITYILFIPVTFLLAVIIIDIYNISVGGKLLSLNELLFPMRGNPYVNSLNIELDRNPSAWMLVVILFIIAIIIVLLDTNLCGMERYRRNTVCLSACVIAGIVQMMYFINRSVYGNLYIILSVSVIIIAIIVDLFNVKEIWERQYLGNGILRAFLVIQPVILIGLVCMMIPRYFYVEIERSKNRNMSFVYEISEQIKADVPPNTLAIGMGLPEIYSLLGWDTGYYGIDMSDYAISSDICKQYTVELIEQVDEILIDKGTLEEITSSANGMLDDFSNNHYIANQYDVNGVVYTYYRRK